MKLFQNFLQQRDTKEEYRSLVKLEEGRIIEPTKDSVDAHHKRAHKIYKDIIDRWYNELSLATTMNAKMDTLDSEKFTRFIQGELADLTKAELDRVIEYFNKRHAPAKERYERAIYCMRFVEGAQQSLSLSGFFNQHTQCSALSWATQREIKLLTQEPYPILKALGQTATRATLATGGEVIFNEILSLIRQWDGATEYPNLQKYGLPIFMLLTVIGFIVKGIFDYRVYQTSIKELEATMNLEEAGLLKFDRDICSRVVSIAGEARDKSIALEREKSTKKIVRAKSTESQSDKLDPEVETVKYLSEDDVRTVRLN